MTKKNFLTLLILGLVLNLYCIDVYGWHQLPGNGLEVDAIAANADESRIVIGLRFAGFWFSEDSGENWIPINDRILPPNASTFYPKVIDELYMLDAAGDTIITRYQCDRSVGWAYSISTDGGNSWNAVMPPNTIYNTQNEYMEIDPADHNRFYYCNATHFTYSLDFGTTWEDTIRIDSLGNLPTDFVLIVSIQIPYTGPHIVHKGLVTVMIVDKHGSIQMSRIFMV